MTGGASDRPPAGELRAGELVALAPGVSTGLDPSARWERAVPELPPVPAFFTPRITLHAEPERWCFVRSGSVEYAVPPELQSDLRENMPQALLRDLERPDEVRGALFEIRKDTQLLGLWEEGFRLVAEAKRRERAPHVMSAAELFAEEQERRRLLFATPWEPVLADDEPRRLVVLYPTGD